MRPLIWCVLGLLPTLQAASLYQLEETDDPLRLRVTLSVEGNAPYRLSPSRSQPGQAGVTPVCLDDKKGVMGALTHCRQWQWSIPLTPAPAEGVDAALQQSVRLGPGSWLVSEWGNFPRTGGEARVCLPDGSCTPLPPLSAPPLFLSQGLATLKTQSRANVRITHDAMAERLPLDSLQGQLEAILAYLGEQLDRPMPPDWHLIWLARDVESHSLGGAAGANLFVANYPVRRGEPTAEATQRLLRISAHEAVHQLLTEDWPAWAAEGLAEYLAIKSLRHFRLQGERAVDEWQARALPDKRSGLYLAYERLREGDPSLYPLFYVKGAAFWEELDHRLAGQGISPGSWPARLTFDEQGQLDAGSQRWLEEVLGPLRWQGLEQRYLK